MGEFRRSIIVMFVTLLAALAAAGFCASARAQEPPAVPTPTPAASPEPEGETLSEADPTRPMFIAVRHEFRDLKNGAWASAAVFRHDRFVLRNLGVKGGGRGFVLRFDVPLNTVRAGGSTKFGLGDIYAQALWIPRINRRFAFSVGSGISLPTATNRLLGQGKLVIAPVAVPLWYFAKRKRLVTLRMQHFVSVAGSGSRPNVNFTVVDPSIGVAVGRRSWIFTSTEFRWDWRTKLNSATTGIQFGRLLSNRLGFWVKPEIQWGPGRQGDFNVKFGFFRFR